MNYFFFAPPRATKIKDSCDGNFLGLVRAISDQMNEYRCIDQVEEVLDAGALVHVDDGRGLSLDSDAALTLHAKLV